MSTSKMNEVHTSSGVFRQRGYTLVELLVGLFVGLLVGTVAITFLLTSSRTIATQNAEDIVQENARFALEILASSIRLAGSNTSKNAQTQTLSQGIFRGLICSGADCNSNNTVFEVGAAGVNRIKSRTDRAAFEYITNTGRACTGQTITSEKQIVNVFYVADTDNDDVASLYCETFESTLDYVTQSFVNHTSLGAQPLIDGVEMLQVQYGIDTDNSGSTDRYMSYDNIAASEFGSIKAVRLGLVLSNIQEEVAGNKLTEETAKRTFTVLDGSLDAEDAVLRQVVSTTVFLPNSSSNI